MRTMNIWDLKNDLRRYGFWYCVWVGNSLWDIFVASRMNRHDNLLKEN